MKKLTALTLTFCLLLALTGCQKNTDSSGSGAVADQKGGSVYYLNFKPEVADVYQKMPRLTKRKPASNCGWSQRHPEPMSRR